MNTVVLYVCSELLSFVRFYVLLFLSLFILVHVFRREDLCLFDKKKQFEGSFVAAYGTSQIFICLCIVFVCFYFNDFIVAE